jgi:hypothetical protein
MSIAHSATEESLFISCTKIKVGKASEPNSGATNGCKGKARETLPLGCMDSHGGKMCRWPMLCKIKNGPRACKG